MYRCEVCTKLSKSGQALLRHTVYKHGGKLVYDAGRRVQVEVPTKVIVREISVCPVCKVDLDSGTTLEALMALYASQRRELTQVEEYKHKPATQEQLAAIGVPVKKIHQDSR